jgi:hypothetical protein
MRTDFLSELTSSLPSYCPGIRAFAERIAPPHFHELGTPGCNHTPRTASLNIGVYPRLTIAKGEA